MTDDDDDKPIKLTGFVPMGDQKRWITQDEIDRSATFTEPMLRIFSKVPEDMKPGVMSSVVMTYCLKFEDAEDALEWFVDQWKQALPALRAARRATKQ